MLDVAISSIIIQVGALAVLPALAQLLVFLMRGLGADTGVDAPRRAWIGTAGHGRVLDRESEVGSGR